MLDFMRRNARSWGIKAALAAIILVFIFFMGGGGQIGAGPKALVTVGEIQITRPEFDLAERRNEAYFREQFQGQVSEQMLRSLNVPRMTLDQLVDGAVLREEAGRIGLVITEEAIREQLMRVPAFQRDGKFSPALYRETLRAQNMSPGAFEETVRQDLLEAQLADIIRRGSHVSEEEAWQAYQLQNRKITLSYVAVDSEPLEKDVTVDDAALEGFYESHKEDYRVPPTVQLRYVAYKVPTLAGKVEVTEVELNEYYELNKNSEFRHDEQVAARHILKKVNGEGDDAKAAARKAIEDVQARLKAGEGFEDLARSESDDPGSATKGGDLGLFSRGRMVPAFEAVAFSTEPGQTSDIVESDFGFHIIQVYDKKPAGVAPFDEVQDQIRQKVAEKKALDFAFEYSAEDAAKLENGGKLDDVASARGLIVEETPSFPQGAVVPGIGTAPNVSEAAFALETPGDVSPPLKVGSDYFLVSLVEKKESTVPPFAEVREAVEQAYRADKAIDAARARADEILEAARGGKALSALAEQHGLEVKTAEDISGGSNFIAGVGQIPGLAEVAFAATKDGEPLARSFVSGNKAFVFVRESVTDAARETFDTVKEEEIRRLENAREQEALKMFIEARKRELQADDRISYDLAQLRPILGDAKLE